MSHARFPRPFRLLQASRSLASLPPLPPASGAGSDVCAIMHLYLAVWDDLSPEQQHTISLHVQQCAVCDTEQRIMKQATRLVATLDASKPSAHVDQAVMAAIAAQTRDNNGHGRNSQRPTRVQTMHLSGRGPLSFAAPVVVATLILITVLTTAYVMKMPRPGAQAFIVPATVSWSAYVLYHTQTKFDSKGERYHINCHHDLATGRMHVETVQDDSLDVVMVSDGKQSLGMDEVSHVAQWGASQWGVNDALFDLNALRHDLNTKQATYLDTDDFHGQKVYRIRSRKGLVLLLDMHYRPVNVLEGAVGPGTGAAIYDTLQLLLPTNVSHDMWSMTVPSGFKMGTLPAKP